MISKIDKAAAMITANFKERFPGKLLEEGDEVTGVFKDCILTIKVEDERLKLEVLMGQPNIFDYSVFGDDEQ